MHLHPQSPAAEHIRSVRTKLLFTSPHGPFHTMVVTSAGRNEGKSSNVINLGIAMAQVGSRVLLLDTNLRAPRLHEAFGLSGEVGLTTVLRGEQSKAVAVQSTKIANLFVLPCGPIPSNPAELLHSEGFHQLLVELSAAFDRIILDSPPVGTVADALVLSTQVDCVMLVLRANQTGRGQARRAVKELREIQARIFGAVLNAVDPATVDPATSSPDAPALPMTAPSTPVVRHSSPPKHSAATGDRA
jgi:capsular exopolysaccharide synthesis family protein